MMFNVFSSATCVSVSYMTPTQSDPLVNLLPEKGSINTVLLYSPFGDLT